MSIAVILLSCLLLAILLCRYFLTIIAVRGESMEPTLMQGDRVLAVQHWPQKWLDQNQIVVIERAADATEFPNQRSTAEGNVDPSLVIKRLIGLPDTTITLPASVLADVPHEMRSKELTYQYDDLGNLIWSIPAGECFLKGDGRFSVDSLFWGPIALDSIKAVVVAKLPRRAGVPSQEFGFDSSVHDVSWSETTNFGSALRDDQTISMQCERAASSLHTFSAKGL